MRAIGRRPLWLRRSIVLLLLAVAALATFTPLASAQANNAGGSAEGTGTYQLSTLTLGVLGMPVAGMPQSATGTVAFADFLGNTLTGAARCIAIDATSTGWRASIAGEITGGTALVEGFQGFEVTVYDNTPSGQSDEVSDIVPYENPRSTCTFDHNDDFTVTGEFTVIPVGDGGCPPSDDEDDDGLTDDRESFFSTLLGSADSDRDGISDGNDDANGNGEDDEDEDDDEEDGCPDEDSDGDGEDDEDEDDDEDD